MYLRRPGRAAARNTVPPSLIDRRSFVTWIGGIALLSACGRGSEAITGPSRIRPPAPTVDPVWDPALNVRDSGAVGDGVTDDTEAFARAIALFGTDGGILAVPEGVYLIDPLRSIRLTDNMTLRLAPNAVLKAIPVVAHRSGVVDIQDAQNVTVTGGTIIGEREGHLGMGGEGGHGIRILGSSDVHIVGVTVKDCWGDGIYVARSNPYLSNTALSQHLYSERVTISKCACRNNRRQGLSVVACVGALIENSEFTDTNGTAPESGIDLEPNGGCTVTDVIVRNCVAVRNAGYGILVCGNDIYKSVQKRILIENNLCAENALAGAFVLRGTSECQLRGNTFERNVNQGVILDGANYNELTSNTLRDNSRGQPGLYPSILLSGGASHNSVLENLFADQKSLLSPPAPEIVVTPDCVDNVLQPTGA